MFGENLRKARMQCGLTQENVARTLDVTLRAYQNYESGKREPNFDTVVKLARLYGVSTDFLFGLDEESSD